MQKKKFPVKKIKIEFLLKKYKKIYLGCSIGPHLLQKILSKI